MNSNSIVFLNGKYLNANEAKLNVSYLAILRGYGVFDYLRTQNKKPFHLADHLIRFRNSANGLHLNLKYDDEALSEIISAIISQNKFDETGIRIELTGGYSENGMTSEEPNIFVYADTVNFPTPDELYNGVAVMTNNFQRESPEIKTINYLRALQLMPERLEKNVFEVLYYHQGLVTEFSRSNVFILKNGILKTPSANILKGITRMVTIKIASSEFDVHETQLSIEELFEADEVFLTGTTKQILPVTKIDDKIFSNGIVGKQTSRLIQLFKEYEANW